MHQFIDITWVYSGKEAQLEQKHIKQWLVRKGAGVSLKLQTKLDADKAS